MSGCQDSERIRKIILKKFFLEMGFEKDYDLRFGHFLYLLSLRFRHHKVVSFHRSLWNEKNSKKFVTILTVHFVD